MLYLNIYVYIILLYYTYKICYSFIILQISKIYKLYLQKYCKFYM